MKKKCYCAAILITVAVAALFMSMEENCDDEQFDETDEQAEEATNAEQPKNPADEKQAPAEASAPAAVKAEPQPYYGRVAQRLAGMLPKCHVLQKPFDDEISRKAWTNLVTFYDFDHSVFLKSDLDALSSHELTLDDELKAGDVSFGYDVYDLYCRRLKERIDFATNLAMTAEFDFTTNEIFRTKRKDAPWPETREDAEAHWRMRIKNEILVSTLSRVLDAEAAEKRKSEGDAADGDDKKDAAEEKKPDTPAEGIVKKYRQYIIALTEPDGENVLQSYLSAVCRAYDPHTDYMSPMSKEEFDMEMNLTLCGVGAVLSMDDGAIKISEVLPGGPMDVDGRIKEGDKIVGVRQGDGEMEDVMWRPMKQTIHKIRGKKGTRVTLDIVPRSDPTGATHKLIELVRDEIKLDEQAATGHVERVEMGGVRTKLGYVYLPSFYGTLDKRPGDEGYLSCAADVAKYVAEFNADGVEGLVLDLRGDGGGSLKEAVSLSSLFVPSGPVVLIRDNRAAMPLSIPSGNPVAFRKPMVVLVDRASASASEIVAGHLRDTGRALVLGDVRTHGKGTVQSVMGMGPEKYGSCKITTARFYRIDGRSTQVEGVEADVHLPSFLDSLDIGEDKLPNALPFTRIAAPKFRTCWNMDAYAGELASLSRERTAGDERFAKHVANVAAAKAIYEREEVPLEREARLAMMRSDRSVNDSMDGDDDDDDESSSRRSRRKKKRGTDDDIVLAEAFKVLADLVRLNGGAQLPPQPVEWYNSILGF